jgi:integrase/recombinase XerD
MKPQISLYLDQRRVKAGNLYPVKIRVWDYLTKRARLFPTNLDIQEKEFQQAWNSQKPRKEFQTLRIMLDALKSNAQKVSEELHLFTFEEFERKLYRKSGSGIDISYHYHQVIEKNIQNGQIGTASNYDLSLKSINKFNAEKRGKQAKGLSFYDITVNWLKEYENYMVQQGGKSYTTVGIYLRPLRAIFNKAISENEIKSDIYPFGNRKYKIPSSSNTKKALTNDQLRQFYLVIPESEIQQKAKDFWFFSYFCNGINIKDIALLKLKDLDGDTLKFYRAKTINTSKGTLKPISVFLNDFAKKVIEKYGSKSKNPEDYVFDILKPEYSASQQKQAIQNFTRFINQHIKLLCKKLNLPDISTYWARHSFATMSIRGGASMELIQESLGHGNLKTTMNYFAGFEDEAKKELSKKLLMF